MTFYVNGLLISEDKTKVALIQKNRPEFQRGKLNGIGGHVEEGEFSIDAMCREFREETGVATVREQWEVLCTLKGVDYIVEFFKAFGDWNITTMTDEKVDWYSIDDVLNLKVDVLLNIRWLLLLALDVDAAFAIVINDKQQRIKDNENCK